MSVRPDTQFDYAANGVVGEVKSRLRSVSALRDGVMRLAVYLARHPDARGFMMLHEPAISDERLQNEWAGIESALSPGVVERLILVKHTGRTYEGWPRRPQPDLVAHLRKAFDAKPAAGEVLPRADCRSLVLIVLLENLLSRSSPGALTVKSICEAAGCSYPSVAATLDELEPVLRRTPDRSVELRRFPTDEWRALVLASRKLRSSRYFRDASGQPRPPAALIERLGKMQLDHVAVGGVPAATAWFQDLDIVGNPRLDLLVHAPGKRADLAFIHQLDPALQESDDLSTPANLALHFTRSKQDHFAEWTMGLKKAGRVDCLLDLHDLGFGQQAEEWLHAMLEGATG
jgi:hypothetical protein